MKTYLTSLFILISNILFCQNVDYFQQQVDYDLSVTLDTTNHSISTKGNFIYTNNAPQAISSIIIHVYSNAYKDNTSAFAKQKIRLGMSDFHFAKEETKGGYTLLKFNSDRKELEYSNYKGHQDIIELSLQTPIESGASRKIDFQSIIKIPKFYSRMGYTKGFYQITQWYPKPAVYDHEGWHPMPYLEMGEYFSEFGSYKIQLETPTDYTSVATGINTSKTNSNGNTVWTFEAEKVHDFAWVSSNNRILEQDTSVIDGNIIDVFVLRKADEESWSSALPHAKRALQFYSDQVGTYPYPQMTVVQSPNGTGSGMEYPMITTIDISSSKQIVDHVIAHEIGHNWFYGILATNERKYPWMDEGLNTYFDHQYNNQYYSDPNYDENMPAYFAGDPKKSMLKQSVIWQLRRGKHQSCKMHSQDFSMINYGIAVYEMPSWYFDYLRSYLGDDTFSSCIKYYYENYKFKHPSPADLQHSFEQTSKQNLDWFFNDLLSNKSQFDLAIKKVARKNGFTEIQLKNKSGLSIPVLLETVTNGQATAAEWIPPFENDTIIQWNKTQEFDKVSINYSKPFIDIFRKDNVYDMNKTFPSSRSKEVKLLGSVEKDDKYQIGIMPIFGYNHYNGLTPSLTFYNSVFPQKEWRWFLQTGYGFKSNTFAGQFLTEYDKNLNHPVWRKLRFQLGAKYYGFNEVFSQHLNYFKLNPGISLIRHTDYSNNIDQSLRLQAHIIKVDEIENAIAVAPNNYLIWELEYQRWVKNIIHQRKWNVSLSFENYKDILDQSNKNYLLLQAEIKAKVQYSRRNFFHYRFWAGGFPINSQRYSTSYNNTLTHGSLALAYTGQSDATLDHYFMGRFEQEGLASKQIFEQEGGFRTALISQQSSLGKSNHLAASANLSIDIPLPLFDYVPLKPYLDFGIYGQRELNNNDDVLKFYSLWSMGMSLELFDGIIGLYLPLVNHDDIQLLLDTQSSYWERLSFKFNIQRLKIWDTIDQVEGTIF